MTDDRPVRLLIVDDHPVVRDGLRGMFEGEDGFEVVAEATNGADAISKARAHDPDVVLMDLRMPEMDGVSAIRADDRARDPRSGPRPDHLRHRQRRPARHRGRRHRLPPQGRPPRRAAPGGARRRRRRSRPLPERRRPSSRPGPPAREGDRQPARARGAPARRSGATNREAAERLFVSEATVKTHLLHIYAKLGVNDRAAAVGAAFEKGLLTPGEGR